MPQEKKVGGIVHRDENVNGWRKIYHANMNQKKAEVGILISDIIFKAKKVFRD